MDIEVLVSFLETQPTAIARLLAKHRDDGRGGCLSCGLGQRGYSRWPCVIHAAASRASDRRSDRLSEFLRPGRFPT